jgi:hypothetical protein
MYCVKLRREKNVQKYFEEREAKKSLEIFFRDILAMPMQLNLISDTWYAS